MKNAVFFSAGHGLDCVLNPSCSSAMLGTSQVWQTGSQLQLTSSVEMLLQKIDYIHRNPVVRGYVECSEQWRHSSARYFLTGEKAMIEIVSLEEV